MNKKSKKVVSTKRYGGVCSSCGQTAATCCVGTLHSACRGFVVDYDFKNPVLNALGAERPMRADGTDADTMLMGQWIDNEELLARRAKRVERLLEEAKTRVVLTSVFEDVEVQPTDDPSKGINMQRRYVRTDVTDGLGMPLVRRDGAWVPLAA